MKIMSDRHPPPFLSSKSEESEPPANEWPAAPSPVPHPVYRQQPVENQIDKLKNNPIILGILIGIVIGILLTNMRPVIINPTK
jgi:hypothetical protein